MMVVVMGIIVKNQLPLFLDPLKKEINYGTCNNS